MISLHLPFYRLQNWQVGWWTACIKVSARVYERILLKAGKCERKLDKNYPNVVVVGQIKTTDTHIYV